jgi:hypothetical protein
MFIYIYIDLYMNVFLCMYSTDVCMYFGVLMRA